MIFKDYYKILGLETNRVPLDTIKLAYRQQAKKYHPDVNIGNKNNEEIFKDINEAYRVLSTSSSRRRYDRMWNHHIGRKNKNVTYQESKRSKDSLFSDFFHLFFGTTVEPKMSKRQEKCRGDNLQTEVNITIEDAFRRKEQTIAVRTDDGDLNKNKLQLPPGIQNNEKIRVVGQRKARKEWWEKWRFIHSYQNRR